MSIPVQNLAALTPAQSLPASSGGTAKQGEGFQQIFSQMLDGVNQSQVSADQSLEELVKGETDSVHDVVLSMAKADLAFRLMLEIRNRLTESYQEIIRMQV